MELENPDKKKKLKRIIAREGLVLLGIIFLGTLILLFSISLMNKNNILFRFLPLDYYTTEIVLAKILKAIGISITILGYPAYLLIRFINWAIKTLKEI